MSMIGGTEPEDACVAVTCTTEQNVLGEGVRWDSRRCELLRVDILDGRIYRDHVDDTGDLVAVGVYEVPGTVGAIAPIEGDPGWLLATGRGFAFLTPDGSFRSLAQVAPPGTRMNDGACDPQGRFWAGTLADDHHDGGGALYRLDQSGRIEVVLDDLTISNGVDWSPDGTTMYLVDSGPRVVYSFVFDGERGAISDRRVIISMDEGLGAPDGMTVDSAGDLWVAIYGGGCIHRYRSDGVLRQVLPVPAELTTCCGFAGPGLHRLYVTTATEGWSDADRRAEPLAGLVYRIDTDATGRAASPFRPHRPWWDATTQLR